MRILSMSIAAGFLASSALAIGACGSSSDGSNNTNANNTTGTGDDAGNSGTNNVNGTQDSGIADAGIDTNDPLDPNYPASHTPIPQVDYQGGRVLTAPKIVTVTYDGDALRTRLETFGDTITATPWWDAVRAGYCSPQGGATCIGQGTGGGHVHLPVAGLPSSFTDTTDPGGASTVQDLVKQVADGMTVDDQTLITIYFPASVSITLTSNGQPAQSCSNGGFGGYHSTITYTPPAVDGGAAGTPFNLPYAILPRCDSAEASTTISASHELIEAATDPDVGLANSPATQGLIGYYMNDQLWAFAGGETGDVCVDFTGQGNDQYIESTFTVQRAWSNTSAAASHDPCVPIPSGSVYFNVAPAGTTAQITLGVGKSQTIELDAFSDAPMDDWTISFIEFASFQGGTSVLEFTPDKTTVHNGSKVHVGIKLKSMPPSQGQGPANSAYAIVSKDKNGMTRYWPAVVIAQ